MDWDGEMLLPGGALARQPTMATGLAGGVVTQDTELVGELQAMKITRNLHNVSNSCRTWWRRISGGASPGS